MHKTSGLKDTLHENVQSPDTKPQNGFVAWLLLIVLAIIWGSSFILIKRAVSTRDFTPIHVASLRIMSAGIIFLPLAVYHIRKVPFKRLKYFLLAGSIGNLIPAFLFAISMPYMESSVSGIMNSLSPLFTLLTGAFIWRQKFSLSKILGVLVGLSGSLMLILFRENFEFHINYYALLVVLATIMYGINTNILKASFQDVPPLQFASISFLLIGTISAIVFFSTDGWSALWKSHDTIVAGGYTILLSVAGSAFALVLFTRLIQMTTAIFSASVTYLIPFVSVIWGIIDQENIGSIQLIGMGVILLGIFLVRKQN